jgi:hypothetical protein
MPELLQYAFHRLLLEQVWAHFDSLKFVTVINPEIGVSVAYLAVMAAYRNGDVQVRRDVSCRVSRA